MDTPMPTVQKLYDSKSSHDEGQSVGLEKKKSINSAILRFCPILIVIASFHGYNCFHVNLIDDQNIHDRSCKVAM